MKRGEPFLKLPFGKYLNDAGKLDLLRQRAISDFKDISARHALMLKEMETEGGAYTFADQAEASRLPAEAVEESTQALGQWFTDYLFANGYWVDDNPVLWKQMIMNAFPPVNDGQIMTPENVEQYLLNYHQVFNRHVSLNESSDVQMLLAAAAAKPANAGKLFCVPQQPTHSRNSLAGCEGENSATS